MKLIIDVPEEVYECLKGIAEDKTSLDPYSLADIIVNKSNPYEDRPPVDLWKMRQEATENALKKAEVLYKRPTVCGNNPKWCETCVSKGKCASTRPQGDLISREALKEQFTEGAYTAKGVREIIDSAPTVEYTFEEAFQKTVCEQKLYCPKRPQGEWIDHSEDYGYVECPFCHELTTCSDNADELHFCWNCGAKLRKGGAE